LVYKEFSLLDPYQIVVNRMLLMLRAIKLNGFTRLALTIAMTIVMLGLIGTSIGAAQEKESVLGSKRKIPFSLRGDIYFLERNTSRLPDFSQLKSVGTIYVEELNITPRSFQQGFPGVTGRYEWFAIAYKGTFRIKEPGHYNFRLTSDDGALLFIDGDKVIDNDGLHPPRRRENSVKLRKGLHKVRVQYFQGPATEIALVLEMAKVGQDYAIFKPKEMMQTLNNNWLEVLMDTTTLIATFVLLAFMVERLTNGIAVVLGYWGWWRTRMEVSLTADLDTKSRIDRNRRVFLFVLSAVLAVTGSVFMELSLLSQLGVELPALAGEVVTGLLVASGADPIREFVNIRRQRDQETTPPSTPIQVTGTLVVHNAPSADSHKDKEEG